MSEQLSETIYERIRRETAKHHAAFWTWYELERNYDQTKTKLRVAPNTLAAWIKKFAWHERAKCWCRETTGKPELSLFFHTKKDS
jgi:hypothetical protein